jgi:hypothetical protein
MELLNGDLSLADMEYALNPTTLEQRYNPELIKQSLVPKRTSPHQSNSRTPNKKKSKENDLANTLSGKNTNTVQ